MDRTQREPHASIVLITHDRLEMLRLCIDTILANTHGVDYELIVWDNASSDGTGAYLDSVSERHPHIRVAHSSENIGLNAVAAAIRLARGHYIIEMDDDILSVPDGWLAEMIRCFEAVPRAGYLAANVVQNDLTNGAKPESTRYFTADFGDGVVIEVGPTGGWCSITSRDVIEHIGNFVEMEGRVFFGEDGEFATRCLLRGYRIGIIRSVRVFHACGPLANEAFGCLDVCKRKYADDPQYASTLQAIREMESETGGDSRALEALRAIRESMGQAAVTVEPGPTLTGPERTRLLRSVDQAIRPAIAEGRLKQQLKNGDLSNARRLLWQARSMNPDPVRRAAMLALGLVSPRLLARRWRSLENR